MAKFGIGQPVRRLEDRRFLTGSGCYVEDIVLPRQAYGVTVLSPRPHARIRRIDAAAAEASPGVLCVLTGADIAKDGIGAMAGLMPEDMGGPKGFRAPWPLLVTDLVRHVGDRVAFVVAQTLAEAHDAAALVEVDYEALPAVTGLEQAIDPAAPQLWAEAPGNVSFTVEMGDRTATDAAFAKAKWVGKVRLVNNRISANSVETRGAIGDYNAGDETYTLYTSSQIPHMTRGVIAERVLQIPESRLRVVARDVGGGFGMKGDTYPEEGLVLWASRRCGRPVKWIASRSESLLSDCHGRDQIVEGEMALDGDGRILGVRARGLHGLGAYVAGAGIIPVMSSLTMIPQVYEMPAIHLVTRAVFNNTAPVAPYRGAGRPEATYFTERLIEEAARASGIDPVELRRRNYIPVSAMPHTTLTGVTYDSGDFEGAMKKCLALADWDGYGIRREASAGRGRLRGRALISYLEICGFHNDRMEMRFDPGGGLTIVAGTFSHGQGHATTFAQMASEWLGIPIKTIRFIQGDTDQVSFGRGTYGSRTSVVGSGALKAASEIIVDKAKQLAGHMLEASPADLSFAEGRFTVTGTDRSVTLIDVAKAAFAPMMLPPGFGVGLQAAGDYDPAQNYPNGCHVCEVEVDRETGVVTIDRYAVVDDVGFVINPMIVEGQVQGGLAQGIGQALLEFIEYEASSGQLLSGSFSDYAMPRADHMPDFACAFNNVPCTTNPLGLKGAGEAGAVAAPPAVINAILDAIRPLGVTAIDMPATPRRVWEAIEAAGRAAGR